MKRGGDRQELHEKIRAHSQEAAKRVKGEGQPNDLLERIASDPAFANVKDHVGKLADANHYVGLAAEQAREFLDSQVKPVLHARRRRLGLKGNVEV